MGMRPDQPWNEDALTDACRTFLFRFNWFSECCITRGQARTQPLEALNQSSAFIDGLLDIMIEFFFRQ
jgi:hypothetical protein